MNPYGLGNMAEAPLSLFSSPPSLFLPFSVGLVTPWAGFQSSVDSEDSWLTHIFQVGFHLIPLLLLISVPG